MKGFVCTNSFAGRREFSAEIVGETPKRYRVRLLEKALLPTGWHETGAVVLIPKQAFKAA